MRDIPKQMRFLGVNDIHTLQFTYSDVVDENIMYCGLTVQSNTRKTPEDIFILLSEDQLQEIYDYMVHRKKEMMTEQ